MSNIHTSPRRLTKFLVEGLYGEFNHQIPLNSSDHVTAIIAPNGMGKTLCLKMIQSLFDKNWNYFENIIFQKAVYEFNDGSEIELTLHDQELNDQDYEDRITFLSISLKLSGQKKPTKIKLDTPHLAPLYLIRREAPFLRKVSPDQWVNQLDGERLTSHEVRMKFGYLVRRKAPPSRRASRINSRLDGYPELVEFLGEINCKLIETQRLINLREDSGEFQDRRRSRPTYAISEKADSLRNIISEETNNYATLSQALDRTFPHRVIQSTNVVTKQNIKTELVKLEEKRRDYMEVGILASEDEVRLELPDEEIEVSLARVLSVYIEDNHKKLDSLDNLFRRIKLFQELIRQRFGEKTVAINKTSGIEVSFSDAEVPLEKLSSGEQHQLVLFFELLFEIQPNTLILIDEPEISLHVAWQKKFISDLLQIIQLNKFDVVLATHSPQLIGKWSDLVVELGDVE